MPTALNASLKIEADASGRARIGAEVGRVDIRWFGRWVTEIVR